MSNGRKKKLLSRVEQLSNEAKLNKYKVSDACDVGDAGDLERTFPGQDYLSAWSTPEAFGRYVGSLSENQAWCNSGWDTDDYRFRFTGTKDMEEAVYLSEGNWKEGTVLIDKVTNLFKTKYPLRKEPVKYGIVGSYPSIPRAVAGNLFNMVSVDPTRSKRRQVITLISDTSANAYVASTSFIHRAAAVTALVDDIENKGFSCEIIVMANSSGNRFSGNREYKVTTAIRVKEAHQPLDLPRIAFALGHPSLFRRFIFADWGSHKKNEDGLGMGLGSCQAYKIPNSDEGLSTYLIPSAEGKQEKFFKSEESVIKYGLEFLIESLQSQKCPAFEKKFNFTYFDEDGNIKSPKED